METVRITGLVASGRVFGSEDSVFCEIAVISQPLSSDPVMSVVLNKNDPELANRKRIFNLKKKGQLAI